MNHGSKLTSQPRLSLVIPAFEEAALITETLNQVRAYLLTSGLLDQTEVVVVVAEGRDNTQQLVEAQADRFPLFQLVLPGKKAGKGRDVKAGVLAARGNLILFTDADLATPLHHIQPTLALLESGSAEVVIGVRNLWQVHKTFRRRLLSSGANVLIRLALLPGIQDSQCGFKGFSRNAAQQLFSHLQTSGWGFDLELLASAREKKLSIRSVQITDWSDPKLSAGLVGESAWRASVATLKELWEVRQRHPNVGRPLVRFSLALVLSGAVFLGLQLISLQRWSLWHDESFTAMLIQYDWTELLTRASYDVHPPLYYLLLKLWAGVFGSSVLALRSFSVICMAVVFLLTLWLIQRLVGLKAAWWALPFLALAPALVRYGQEARMYGMAAILGLCATHLLLFLLENKAASKNARWWILWCAYLLSLIALLYTHYFGFLVVLTHWALFWVYARGARPVPVGNPSVAGMMKTTWWWPLTFILLLLAFIPWAPSFQRQLSGTSHNFWVGEVSVASLFSTISSFLFFRPEWLTWRLTGWYAVLALLGATLVGYLIFTTLKTSRLSALAKTVLLSYWSLPMLALFLLSLPPLTPYYYDRYFVTFSPVFYSLLGVGSWVLISDSKKSTVYKLLVPATLFGLLLFGTWNVQIYGNNFGHSYDDSFSMQELVTHIKPRWQPGDVVVCLSREQFFDAYIYLGELTQVQYYTPTPVGPYGDTSVIYGRDDIQVYDLSSLSPASGRVWIISDKDEGFTASVPTNWQAGFEPIEAGYARADLYLVK